MSEEFGLMVGGEATNNNYSNYSHPRGGLIVVVIVGDLYILIPPE